MKICTSFKITKAMVKLMRGYDKDNVIVKYLKKGGKSHHVSRRHLSFHPVPTALYKQMIQELK